MNKKYDNKCQIVKPLNIKLIPNYVKYIASINIRFTYVCPQFVYMINCCVKVGEIYAYISINGLYTK